MPSLALPLQARPQRQPLPARVPLIAIGGQGGQNHLLRALPDEVWNRIAPDLQLKELQPGTCLVDESSGLVEYVYFPTNSVVALLCMMENGTSAQAAMVGVEGMVGFSPFTDLETSAGRAIVQSTGYAFKLPARVLMREFEQTPAVTRLLLCYTQSLITQMIQTAGCNRFHSIEQQFCRCLLSIIDRLPGNDLAITHELLAKMIGARREGVTEAAGKLQRLGAISYRRGHVTVVDRLTLERLACECYTVIKHETERLLA